jgi:hypothetical protein
MQNSDNLKVIIPEARIQSFMHMSASTFSGVKQLRKSDIVLLPVLKADSVGVLDRQPTKGSTRSR